MQRPVFRPAVDEDTAASQSVSGRSRDRPVLTLLFGTNSAFFSLGGVLMYSRAARAALLAVVAATIISAACATRINNVLADPSRYRDREVQVSGVVADSYSLIGRGAYRLEDKSGQLWVVSDRGVPRKGSKVVVRGRVRDGFNLSGLEKLVRIPTGLVLVESSHRVD